MKEKYFCISKILSISYVLVSVKLNIHLYKVVIWSTYKTCPHKFSFTKHVVTSFPSQNMSPQVFLHETCPHKFSFTKCFPTKCFLTKRFLPQNVSFIKTISPEYGSCHKTLPHIRYSPQNVASHKIFTTKRCLT